MNKQTATATCEIIHTNCLICGIWNDDGERYGTVYIFFPYKTVREDVLQKILLNHGVSQDRRLYKNPSANFRYKDQDELDFSGDVWNQTFVENANSIEQAISIYEALR